MKKKLGILLAFMGFFCIALVAGCGKLEIKLSTENDVLLVKPGSSVQLVTTIEKGDGNVNDAEYSLISGPATIYESGLLTVNANATAGTEIKVQSKIGDVKSNTLTITVDVISLQSITAQAETLSVEPGATTKLSYVLNPSNTTDNVVTWEIVTGGNIAELYKANNGDQMLRVAVTANQGDTIVVKASVGDKSNSITITVSEAVSSARQISASNVTLDVNGSAVTFTPELIRLSDGATIDTATFTCQLADGGSNIVNIVKNADGKSFTFNILGHGTTTMVVSCPGLTGVTPKTVTVKSVVPPTNISMPAYLTAYSNNIPTYKVGKSTVGNSQALPFLPSAEKGTYSSVSTEFTYSFKLNGVADSECARYENGAVTFLKEGNIEVTVTSVSGSKDAQNNSMEVSAKYLFEVNGYKNAYTYEQFKTFTEARQAVNVIVTTKPSDATGYTYEDYDLVPSFILELTKTSGFSQDEENNLYVKAQQAQVLIQPTRLVGGGVEEIIINGNGHAVNVSKLPIFQHAKGSSLGPLIYVEPALIYNEEGVLQDKGLDPDMIKDAPALKDTNTYKISISNLRVVGNVGVNFNSDGQTVPSSLYGSSGMTSGIYMYTYREGIRIGQDRRMKLMHLQMKNVDVEGFNVGLRICHTVEITEDGNTIQSTLDNVKVSDIYKAGIEFNACMIDLKDMTFGLCGQGPMEVTADSYKYSGVAFNESQVVNIISLKDMTGAKDTYETPYFNAFATAAGATKIIEVLGGALSQGDQSNANAHIFTADGKFAFVGLVFGDPSKNGSTLTYSNQIKGAWEIANGATVTEKIIAINLGDYGFAYLLNLNS